MALPDDLVDRYWYGEQGQKRDRMSFGTKRATMAIAKIDQAIGGDETR
jgi:hypothetical protein